MSFDLGNLLQQFTGAMANPAEGNNAATQSQLSQGLGQAFRSDQTPPFAQMAAQLFGNSDPTRRAGMLNQILSSVGPGVLASLASGGLGHLFSGAQATGQVPQITPEQASQVTPEQVQEIAAKAEQDNPSVIDRVGDFYAQHPDLVKGLGGAALAIALGHFAQNMQRN